MPKSGRDKVDESGKSDDGQPKAPGDQDARAELRAIGSGNKPILCTPLSLSFESHAVRSRRPGRESRVEVELKSKVELEVSVRHASDVDKVVALSVDFPCIVFI